jgi:hypothetical protein
VESEGAADEAVLEVLEKSEKYPPFYKKVFFLNNLLAVDVLSTCNLQLNSSFYLHRCDV